VLIAICGSFFVLGFIEGKRQGIKEGNQTAAETAHKAAPAPVQAQTQTPKAPAGGAGRASGAGRAGETPAKEDPLKQQLTWPKVVTSGEAKDASLTTKAVKEPAADLEAKTKPQAKGAHAEPGTYTVQVGAFRVQREAESKAKSLRSQEYDCRIEEPQSPGGYYLLK